MEKASYHDISAASKGDVRISYKDYLMLIGSINDIGLSKEGIWKFKLLWTVNYNGIMITPVLGFIGATLLNRFILGNVNKGSAMARIKYPMYLLTTPIVCYFLYSKPLPRRLYTELIAGTDDDAEYVRKEIQHKLPGYWTQLSKQLHTLGYDFPEMHEYSERVEFPRLAKTL